MSAVSPQATIKCAGFAADGLHLMDFSGHEELGRPFQYQARVSASDQAIKLDKFVGKEVTVSVPTPGSGGASARVVFATDKVRYFNGLVIRASFAGIAGDSGIYDLSVVPSFWRLTLKSNCRIFQKQTIPEIFRKVFSEHGISGDKYDDSALVGSYKKKDFVVQYRETDFNFLSRLMEQEGIAYYFKHSNGNHKLLTIDSPDGNKSVPGLEKVPFECLK